MQSRHAEQHRCKLSDKRCFLLRADFDYAHSVQTQHIFHFPICSVRKGSVHKVCNVCICRQYAHLPMKNE
jgi:hypothetical protein